MFHYLQAEALVKSWVELATDGKAELLLNETISKPYGWIFFYQSKQFLKTNKFSDMLLGNAPILVRRDGELKVFGTAKSIEQYLEEYERNLPEAIMQMTPEYPKNL
jgi:hypothetical protein